MRTRFRMGCYLISPEDQKRNSCYQLGLEPSLLRVSGGRTFVKGSPHSCVHLHFIYVAVLCSWMKRNVQSIQTHHLHTAHMHFMQNIFCALH